MIYFWLSSSHPRKRCISHRMPEKVPLNQLQAWSSPTFRKENQKFLQAQYYLRCYLKCYGDLVYQTGCNFIQPEIIKIFLKRLDSSQLRQNTSTIAGLCCCATQKVVAKHTGGAKSTDDDYGTFLQA
jgi:hypothetical protein